MKKLFLFIAAALVSTGMLAAINNTTVTKAGGSQKYIDVTTTAASDGDEVTVEKEYIAYTIAELVSNSILGVWHTQQSSGTGSSNSDAVSKTGFRTTCNKYINFSSTAGYSFYVTNCVSFSVLYDPRGGSRYCTITATNVDDDTDVLTESNTGSVSSGTKYDVTLTGLSATKYYKIDITTNSSSGSRLYQVRLGAYVNTSGPFTITYDANGGTGTMTDASSPYAKNATVTVLANTFTAPTGCTFTGWNTKANGAGISYAAGDTFSATEDVTLYAQWAYPPTGTGTITYTLTKGSNNVSAAITGVTTISSSATAFTVTGLTMDSQNALDNYSGEIKGQQADYSDSKYVALQFTIDNNYELALSTVSMTIYARGTGDMKAKVVISDGKTSIESNTLSCTENTDSDISFAAGAFSGKKFKGDVTIKVFQWGKTNKYVYIKTPVTITGTVTEKPAAPISWKLSEAVVDAAEVTYGTTPYVFPTLSNDESLAVTYSSSNADVASISNEEGHEGEITIVSAGSANISATYTATAQGAYKTTVVSYALTVKSGSGTALDETVDEAKAVKFIKDGQIFIEKNGHVYNVLGGCVK